MKRQLAVAFGLAVVAAPAFATKARLQALGEETNGSYYINDNRNYFLNPARINNHKDLITYEFGAASTATAGEDAPASPRAEGGFTKAHGNLVWGLHLGNSTPAVGALRALPEPNPGAGANTLQERQPWDLFVGGDAGMKWGANVTYESFDGGSATAGDRIASNSLRVRGGVIMGDIEAFGHISVMNEAKDFAGQEVKADLGFMVGASTMIHNYRVFGDFTKIGADYQGATTVAAQDADFDSNRLRIGAGRQDRLNDRATLFTRAMLIRQTIEDEGGATVSRNTGTTVTTGADVETYLLPLVVGLEYAATSWLDLRASVSQNVWSKNETDLKGAGTTSTHVSGTAVRAGASIKFGEFAIDGLISTSTGAITAGTDDETTTGGNGAIRTDELMTRVGMVYRF